MKKFLLLIFTHIAVGAGGFALGIYALPILQAPSAPATSELAAMQSQAAFTGQFRRDLQDSDFLHWGEGEVSIGDGSIALVGSLAPGPDYRLYLSPTFVETEKDFMARKGTMVQVAPVKTFENFIVSIPDDVDPSAYNTVVIWCEAFGQFITAAQYQ